MNCRILFQTGENIPENLLEDVQVLRDSFDGEGEGKACTQRLSLGRLMREYEGCTVLHLLLLRHLQ